MKANYDGKGCKGPDKHTWKAGDEVFYDKESKAICIDSKCFQALRDGAKQSSPSGNGAPARTDEQRMTDSRIQLENLWPACKQKAFNEYFENPDIAKASDLRTADPAKYEKAMILAQCLFKCTSMVWAR